MTGSSLLPKIHPECCLKFRPVASILYFARFARDAAIKVQGIRNELDADLGPPFHPPMPHSCFRAIWLLCLFALTASVCSAADLSQAVVRQKVNIVTVAPNVGAQAHPATQGTVVRDENIVRTGSESRAELEFTDLTLARMGSNSIFSFDAQARALSFTQGAVLFRNQPSRAQSSCAPARSQPRLRVLPDLFPTYRSAGCRTVRHAPAHTGDSTTMVGCLKAT